MGSLSYGFQALVSFLLNIPSADDCFISALTIFINLGPRKFIGLCTTRFCARSLSKRSSKRSCRFLSLNNFFCASIYYITSLKFLFSLESYILYKSLPAAVFKIIDFICFNAKVLKGTKILDCPSSHLGLVQQVWSLLRSQEQQNVAQQCTN